MGTTTFMVMANKKPEYQQHIKLASFLAPVAYVDHMTSPLKYVAPFVNQIDVSIHIHNHLQASFLAFLKSLKIVLHSGFWNFWAQENFYQAMHSWIGWPAFSVTKGPCRAFALTSSLSSVDLMSLKLTKPCWKPSCITLPRGPPPTALCTLLKKLIQVRAAILKHT